MNIFYYIALPFGYLMRFCCFISPGHNYVIALIFFTLIIQVLLCLLFGIKQQKGMQKQAAMAPKAAAIRKKYAGRDDPATKQKMQQETMELYQENGYNPLGGCLPMLIQLPVIMALYYVIVYPMQYICMLGKDAVAQIILDFKNAELLSEAAVKQLGDKFDVGSSLTTTRTAQAEIINKVSAWRAAGSDPSDAIAGIIPESLKTGLLPEYKLGFLDFSANPPYPNSDSFKTLWPLLIIPVLIVATMIISQILTRKFSYQDPSTKEQQDNCSMKVMTYGMPFLSAWISFSLPAAVGVYWVYRSIAATFQQFVLSKVLPLPKFTEEDYKAAEREIGASSKKNKNKKSGTNTTAATGEKKRSLHHIDDDDEDYPAIAEGSKLNGSEEEFEAAKSDAESDAEKAMKPDPADAPKMKDDKNTKYKKKF